MKVHPVFLLFDPEGSNNSEVKLIDEDNSKDKLIKKLPTNLNQIPLVYELSIKEDCLEISHGKDCITIETFLKRISIAINNSGLSRVIELGIPDDVKDGKRYYITNLDSFIDDYRRNKQEFWYLRGVFACPFALLFCHENSQYVDQRGLPEGLVLIIPKYKCNSTNGDNHLLDSITQLFNEFNGEYYEGTYRFFEYLGNAAKIWVELVESKFYEKYGTNANLMLFNATRSQLNAY